MSAFEEDRTMQDELRSAALEAERRVTALEALLAQRDADITQLKQVTSRGSTVLRLNIFWRVGGVSGFHYRKYVSDRSRGVVFFSQMIGFSSQSPCLYTDFYPKYRFSQSWIFPSLSIFPRCANCVAFPIASLFMYVQFSRLAHWLASMTMIF